LLRRLHDWPTRETIIAFHELHAYHERQVGRHENAERAMARARAVAASGWPRYVEVADLRLDG
jgi:hypothetical protein